MQPQSAENHKYVCTYVCFHHEKYPSVLNPVPCKELGFINWAIQCASTNAAFCQTKVEECQCILYLISLPSCLTAPLVASSCQCCPSSHPSHHLLAPGLYQLGQTRQGTLQSQSSERIIKTKGYTMPNPSIHMHVCVKCVTTSIGCSWTLNHTMHTHTPTHAHRVPAHLAIAGPP